MEDRRGQPHPPGSRAAATPVQAALALDATADELYRTFLAHTIDCARCRESDRWCPDGTAMRATWMNAREAAATAHRATGQ